MDNDLKEYYCSFDVSKLLKEKGFKVPTQYFYYTNDIRNWQKDGDIGEGLVDEYWGNNTFLNWNEIGRLPFKPFSECIARPTHSIAVEWLRVNFGIWIAVEICSEGFISNIDREHQDKVIETVTQLLQFKTPQEATESALLYCLNNLI